MQNRLLKWVNNDDICLLNSTDIDFYGFYKNSRLFKGVNIDDNCLLTSLILCAQTFGTC